MDDLAVVVARHGQRLDDLEERLDRHETKQNGSMDKVWTELKGIREDLAGRPTWGTALVITTLASAVVGLAMFVVKGG